VAVPSEAGVAVAGVGGLQVEAGGFAVAIVSLGAVVHTYAKKGA